MRRAILVAAVVLIGATTWWLVSSTDDAPPTPAEPPATARTGPSAPRRVPFDEERAAVPSGVGPSAEARDAGAVTAVDGSVSDEALAKEAKEKFDTVARAQVAKYLEDNAREAAKQIDAYCKASKQLAGKQEPPPRARDAALFMAGRADWEDGHIGLLHLPDVTTEAMRNPPMAWRRASPQIYAGLDFGWMKELLQFDHWSMATASPLRDVAEAKTAADAPLPNFVTLQSWAKLRLLKGLHEKDLAQASLEVRHLANLCGTTGSLVGDMIRIAILGIERGFFEEHGLPTPPALTASDAHLLRHSSFAAKDFLLPGVETAVREKALKCMPNRCSSMVESIASTAMLRDLVPSSGEHMRWLLEQPQCDPALAQLASRFKPMPANEVLDMLGANTLENSMRALLDAGTP